MAETGKLLTDEHPIELLPKLAALIGLNEAIVLQQIHYWAQRGKPGDGGRTWVYNSYPDWQRQFPFWSIATVKRVFLALEKPFEPKDGDSRPARGALLISAPLGQNPLDQTKHYRIDYAEVQAVTGQQAVEPVAQFDTMGDQIDPIDGINLIPSPYQNEPMHGVNLSPSYKEQRLRTETTSREADAPAPAPAHEVPALMRGCYAIEEPDGTTRIVKADPVEVPTETPAGDEPRPKPPARRWGLTEPQFQAFAAYLGRDPGRSEVPAFLAALESVPDATAADLLAGANRACDWWQREHGCRPPANRLNSLVRGIGEAVVARKKAEAELAAPPPPPKPIPLAYQTLEERFAYSERMRALYGPGGSA